ncbi:MAG: Rne/Rng family ribonuclease [Phycisphaerae bacterium]
MAVESATPQESRPPAKKRTRRAGSRKKTGPKKKTAGDSDGNSESSASPDQTKTAPAQSKTGKKKMVAKHRASSTKSKSVKSVKKSTRPKSAKTAKKSADAPAQSSPTARGGRQLVAGSTDAHTKGKSPPKPRRAQASRKASSADRAPEKDRHPDRRPGDGTSRKSSVAPRSDALPVADDSFGIGLLDEPVALDEQSIKPDPVTQADPAPRDKAPKRRASKRGQTVTDKAKRTSTRQPASRRAGPDDKRAAKPAAKARSSQPAAVRSLGAGEYEMIINTAQGDECRIAVLEGGRLEELYIERQSAESHVSSIYKGKVTNVEPSIQAVFVDFGHPKNGFLHISDVHPQYFPNGKGTAEDVGRKIPRRERPPIQKCFRRGQEVLVQVTKEGVGTKGPTLTTYLSIPGRFLVMMPGMKRLGVSRKIEDEADRRSMRDVLNQLDLPQGMGFILRTAGLGRTKRELQRDLNYLHRLWKIIADRVRQLGAPAELYQESDLVIRTMRDVLSTDFKRIVVDSEETAAKAREFLKIALPRTPDMVTLHTGPVPVFHHYGIEDAIERINARKVPLASGGSIIIEQTEAMVTIDVNSGTFRSVSDAEESAFRIDMEAAEEIARQLRLRDLGGLVVCDFIDLRDERHKREVERCLRNALKKHKERARILRMSQFGLIEMTRQRQRSSIRQSIYSECPDCRGSGLVKSPESMALEVMRVIQMAAHQRRVSKVAVIVAPEVCVLVQNVQRAALHNLETETGTVITIDGSEDHSREQITCRCQDQRGRSVASPE